jgi:SEC-C motif domain protein
MTKKCPCHSNKPYSHCCKPFHEGALPKNALELMRSRYAAYALGLADYIIKTTHPDNPAYKEDVIAWKNEILVFCRQADFIGLDIIECIPGQDEACVTFRAHLKKKNKNISFVEKSHFLKIEKRWLYVDGVFSESK